MRIFMTSSEIILGLRERAMTHRKSSSRGIINNKSIPTPRWLRVRMSTELFCTRIRNTTKPTNKCTPKPKS